MVISKLDQILERDDIPSEVKREIQDFNKRYQELKESKNQLQLKEEEIKYLKQKLSLKDQIVEETLKKRSLDLRERVKELICLFEISKLMAERNTPEDELFNKTVELIPSAWQYPEITCAQIVSDNVIYSTKNFQETPWKQSADIFVSGKNTGSVKICYLEERPDSYEGPFLEEERKLINTIAIELGKYIGRKQIENLHRNERQNLNNILNSTDDAIYVVNSEYEIEFMNVITENEFGPVEGRKCYEYFNDFSEACPWCTMNDVLNGETIRREKTLPKNKKTYDMIDTPFRHLDGTIASLAILRDITKRKKTEKALIKSKARLDYLLSFGPAVIYSCIPKDDFRIAFISENVKMITGYDSHEVLADPHFIDNRIHPKDRQRIVESLGNISEQDNYQAVYRFQHKNGSYIWILEEAKLIFDEQGNILDRIGHLTDITERMRVEEALRASEEKYRSFVENFQGIAFKGYEDYSQDLFCGNVEHITGYQEDDFVSGKVAFNDLIHPEDSQLIANDVTEFHSSFRKSTRREYRILDRSGKIRWLQEDIQKFLSDDKEKCGVYGTIQEITKRKLAEEALRQSEERLRRFMDSATESFYLLDSKLNIVETNKNATKVLGLNREEIIGKNIKDLDPTIKDTDRLDKYREIIKTGEALIEEKAFTHSKYGEKYFFVRTFKVGNGLGIISTDITEQKKAEKARADLEQKRENFVWMTSHELRTPLTVLIGYCSFLAEHIKDLSEKRISKILSVMKNNLDRLERLTVKVSSIGQIELGIFEIEKTSMNLCEFLQDTLEPYNLLLEDQFEFQGCLEGSSLSINGDSIRLQQVFDNIIDNAIKHTNKDSRRIKVSSEMFPDRVSITITDNGAGIAQKDLETIFEQFVSIPTEYSSSGTGIGLYLCRKILAAHGGSITAHSKGPGHGSTFIIELPKMNTVD
ncbi:MAG: PAS domain S-box protein [Candidatus Hodarchaeota archaeon]